MVKVVIFCSSLKAIKRPIFFVGVIRIFEGCDTDLVVYYILPLSVFFNESSHET